MTRDEFRTHRAQLGWTQKQAGEALGLTTAQIAAIENDRSAITKTVALLFRLYRFGDWPGRPTGATTGGQT